MEISNKSEYALLALLELATRYSSGESLQIRQMAVLQDIPNRYLEQLLATLRRRGLIKSIRGAKGGYVLAREPQKITLLEVWSCIEGVEAVVANVEHNPGTLENIIIQEIWQEASQAANSVLAKYTLQDLCERRGKKLQKQLMYYI